MSNAPPNSTSSDASGDVRSELKGDARQLKDSAQKQGEAKAEQELERAAKTAQSASSAMNTAASELRDNEDAPDWLAKAFSGAARQVDDLAGRLQNKSPREIAHEASRFARENPTAFLAASAAAGFAAARFLRAGSEYQKDHQDNSDPGTASSFQTDYDYSAASPQSAMNWESPSRGETI